MAFAGIEVPVAPYELYGPPELGIGAADTPGEERNATLLESHGVLTADDSLSSAFEVALMVEYCARIHHLASTVGEPPYCSVIESWQFVTSSPTTG